jgi:hypothetical protein
MSETTSSILSSDLMDFNSIPYNPKKDKSFKSTLPSVSESENETDSFYVNTNTPSEGTSTFFDGILKPSISENSSSIQISPPQPSDELSYDSYMSERSGENIDTENSSSIQIPPPPPSIEQDELSYDSYMSERSGENTDTENSYIPPPPPQPSEGTETFFNNLFKKSKKTKKASRKKTSAKKSKKSSPKKVSRKKSKKTKKAKKSKKFSRKKSKKVYRKKSKKVSRKKSKKTKKARKSKK